MDLCFFFFTSIQDDLKALSRLSDMEGTNDDNVGCWCCSCSLLVCRCLAVCVGVFIHSCVWSFIILQSRFFFSLDIGFIHEITVYPCNIESIDWHRSLTEYSWNAFLSRSTASVNACCQQPLIKYCTLSLLKDDSALQLSVLYHRIFHPQRPSRPTFISPPNNACCTE